MAKSSRKRTYDPKEVFVAASRFNSACEYMLRLDMKNLQQRATAVALAIPELSMSALTVELMLKTLLALQNGVPVPSSHNLANLFRNLASPTRQKIEARWAPVFTIRYPQWEHMRLAVTGGSTPAPTTLEGLLTEASNAFEAFRYAFDFPAIPNYRVDDLRRVLQQVIFDLRPDWKPTSTVLPTEFAMPDHLRGQPK